MALHVQVTERRFGTILVEGEWDDGKKMVSFTLPRKDGETAAETVELAMMDLNLASSWSWSARWDLPMIEGEFSHPNAWVRDSRASEVDIKTFHIHTINK